MREQLAAFGAGEEVLARWRDEDGSSEIEVIERNWVVVETYCACTWTMAGGGMGGFRFIGISAEEIKAAASLLGVRRPDWRRVLRGVRVMANAAAPLLNGSN